MYIEYLCRPSEASTQFCAIPGGNPCQDWQSLPCAGEWARFEPMTTDLQSGALPLSHLSLFFFFFFFLVLSLPWDWSSTNSGEILHIGCSSIAAWIYIFRGAGPGFEPGTALQQSGVLTSRPRLTPKFRQLLCTCIQVDTHHGAILLFFPLPIPFCLPSIPFYLLGNPPWRDRIPSTLVSGYS